VNDLQWKVRRSLSHSLHEVARILGPQLTESVLLSPFDLFLKDLDEVRVGVIRNVASFLSHVPSPTRERYLPVLGDIAGDTSNWRFRKLFANQLGVLGTLFTPDATIKVIFPIAISLLKDPVAKVRQAAAKGFPPLAVRFCSTQSQSSSDEYNEKVLSPLLGLATDNTSFMRQLYAQLCYHLSSQLTPPFFDPFIPPLLALAADPIPNVRISVATVLAESLVPNPHYSQQQNINTTLTSLRGDKDRDVAFAASKLPSPPSLLLNTTDETTTTIVATDNQPTIVETDNQPIIVATTDDQPIIVETTDNQPTNPPS
jgi:serine/threonine-protein phosphatase 4 regulatory subunit 1